MAKKKRQTKVMLKAYEQLTNDQLATVYMDQMEEYKRIERTLKVIRSVAQQRMESLSLRELPTDGNIRIKGSLRSDLRPSEIEKGERNGVRGILIKKVGFEYKDVVEAQNA